MAYTLSGTLKLPDGTSAVGVDIRFVSLTTFSPLIQQAEQTVRTGANGAYSIALETADYNVFVTYANNKSFLAGKININSNTPIGKDLPFLLGGVYEPATPEWILQVEQWLNQAQASATASAASATSSAQDAAKARAQADRAQSEADRAAQITGLDTVSDAVALAALPLPDVWAPLSDSLRLITGYGREVKVGDDVVARMVNFSRSTTATYIGKDGQLKTATANEPRFEKEGLLIEGQSANLFQNSNPHIGVTTADGYTKEVITGSGLFSDCAKLIKKAASAYTTIAPVTSGGSGVYSVSVFYNYAKSTIRNISVLVRNSSASQNIINAVINLDTLKSSSPAFTVEIVDSEWIRVVGTITLTSANQLLMFYPVATGGSSSDGAIGDFIIYQGLQLEALPFASSYIPTAGAAVTRAGDVCSLPASGNWPNGDFVIAATLSYIKGLVENPILFVSGKDTPTAGFINTLLRDTNAPPDNRLAWYGAATSFLTTPGALSTAVFRNRSGMRDIVYDGEILSMGAGVQNAAVPAVRIYLGSYSPTQFLNGHIRNLRIWHRALTDEQIKAIA